MAHAFERRGSVNQSTLHGGGGEASCHGEGAARFANASKWDATVRATRNPCPALLRRRKHILTQSCSRRMWLRKITYCSMR